MYSLQFGSFVAKDFHCLSFDYNFIVGNQQSTCHLSQFIAANVYGLVASPTKRTLHFERKGWFCKPLSHCRFCLCSKYFSMSKPTRVEFHFMLITLRMSLVAIILRLFTLNGVLFSLNAGKYQNMYASSMHRKSRIF